jgi:hypothetical protein
MVSFSSSVFALGIIFRITLVEKESNFTRGAVTIPIYLIGVETNKAILSVHCKAICFGTSSPKTSERYEIKAVVTKIVIP